MKLLNLFKFLSRKKYQIVEKPNPRGEIKFYPMQRPYWRPWWTKVIEPGYLHTVYVGDTLEEAQNNILTVIKVGKTKKSTKKKIHEFDEVFHKLKS